MSYASNLNSVLDEIRQTLLKKHHDYGSDNLLKRGELGILVRCEDKLARLSNLIDNDRLVEDESRMATWIDLAGYAIQAILIEQGLLTKVCTLSNRDKLAQRLYDNLIRRGLCPHCEGFGLGLTENLTEDGISVKFTCSDCGFTYEKTISLVETCDPYAIYHGVVEKALSDVGK